MLAGNLSKGIAGLQGPDRRFSDRRWANVGAVIDHESMGVAQSVAAAANNTFGVVRGQIGVFVLDDVGILS